MRRITFSEDAAIAFRNISLKAINSKSHQILLSAIYNKLDLLRARDYGQKISTPQEFSEFTEGLHKIRLPRYWRMLYTRSTDRIEIIAFTLDVFDNQDYRSKDAGQTGSSSLFPPEGFF